MSAGLTRCEIKWKFFGFCTLLCDISSESSQTCCIRKIWRFWRDLGWKIWNLKFQILWKSWKIDFFNWFFPKIAADPPSSTHKIHGTCYRNFKRQLDTLCIDWKSKISNLKRFWLRTTWSCTLSGVLRAATFLVYWCQSRLVCFRSWIYRCER